MRFKGIVASKQVLKCNPNRLTSYRQLGGLNSKRGFVSSAVLDYLILAKHYRNERKTKEVLDIEGLEMILADPRCHGTKG